MTAETIEVRTNEDRNNQSYQKRPSLPIDLPSSSTTILNERTTQIPIAVEENTTPVPSTFSINANAKLSIDASNVKIIAELELDLETGTEAKTDSENENSNHSTGTAHDMNVNAVNANENTPSQAQPQRERQRQRQRQRPSKHDNIGRAIKKPSSLMSISTAKAKSLSMSNDNHTLSNTHSHSKQNMNMQYIEDSPELKTPETLETEVCSPESTEEAVLSHSSNGGTPYYTNKSIFSYPSTGTPLQNSNDAGNDAGNGNGNGNGSQSRSRAESNPRAFAKIQISKAMSVLKNRQQQTGSVVDSAGGGQLIGTEELMKLNNTDNTTNNDGKPYDYHETLTKYGYQEIRIISPSLQGNIIEADFIDKAGKGYETIIIKITNIRLHELKRSNKNGKTFRVYENVIKEKRLLMYLSANNPPKTLIRFEQFFEDKANYFLVMENGGEDFFDWIVQCHQWVRDGKLTLKQWNQYLRDLMIQITEFMLWLHTRMRVCHLDISLENMLIKNNKWKYDKQGGIRLSRRMQVKFCDFGLAEYFESDFGSDKYVGKTHYKAPKVYAKKEMFDARCADVWSLGVSFFMMLIGAPPYKLPLDNDDHFPYIKKGNVLGILQKWNREHYLNKYTLDLLNIMLCYNDGVRANVIDIYNHKWFKNCRKLAKDSPFVGSLTISIYTVSENSMEDSTVDSNEHGSHHSGGFRRHPGEKTSSKSSKKNKSKSKSKSKSRQHRADSAARSSNPSEQKNGGYSKRLSGQISSFVNKKFSRNHNNNNSSDHSNRNHPDDQRHNNDNNNGKRNKKKKTKKKSNEHSDDQDNNISNGYNGHSPQKVLFQNFVDNEEESRKIHSYRSRKKRASTNV